MENSISGIQNKMSAGQEELRNNMSAIRSGQTEFEEITTEMLDKQLKGVITVVEQRAWDLREEFNSEQQMAQSNIEGTRHSLEGTCR
jgi:hypothetical protein